MRSSDMVYCAEAAVSVSSSSETNAEGPTDRFGTDESLLLDMRGVAGDMPEGVRGDRGVKCGDVIGDCPLVMKTAATAG